MSVKVPGGVWWKRVPIYLDFVQRWVYFFVALLVAWGLTFGPESSQSGPSIRLVKHLGLPLWVYSVAFVIYAICIIFRQTRWQGYGLGAFLYLYFLISLLVATGQGHLGSWVVLGASIVAFVSQMAAAILSLLAGEGIE